MKKLLLTTYTGRPNQNIGGPNKIIYNILSSIDYKNYYVEYFSKHFQYESNYNNLKTFEKQNVSKSRIKKKIAKKISGNPFFLIQHYRKTDKFFTMYENVFRKFDIIHAHDILSFNTIINLKAKKILTIHSKGSIVDDIRDYCESKYLVNSLKKIEEKENNAIKHADIVTFPSLAAKESFLAKKGLSNDNKFKVVYNGIDLKRIDQIDNHHDILDKLKIEQSFDILVLNVADHIIVKNVHVLVDTIEILRNKYNLNPLFVNVGQGPETSNLNKLIQRKRLSKNIVLLKNLPNDDIIRLMKRSDYFIMASKRVVFDVVILEAMAAGTIVIASNEGGNKDIIKNGVNGYLFKNIDANEIAKTILQASTKVSIRAREDIIKFSLEKMMENYSILYNI